MTTTVEAFPASRRQSNTLQRLYSAVWHSYIARKLLKTAFTILAVITLIFFLIRLLPGNPIDQYVNQLVVQYGLPAHEARDQAAALFAIDTTQPLWVQYLVYLQNLLRGDLGNSILSQGTPVTTIILRFLPWTLFSVGMGLILSFCVGTMLGLLMAYWRDSLLDHILAIPASLFSSIPNYLVAILIIKFLGVQWKIVPFAQMRGTLTPGITPGLSLTFLQDVFFHAALPILTYFLTTVGVWMLSMKSSTISTLGEDYVTVARARGLTDWRITTAYVGRNASLPLFTQLTISIGFVVGGSFLVEEIFQYRGLGKVLIDSINQRDYTVMQGVFLIITLSVVLANFFADLLYSWLDPRIKLGKQD